MSFAIFPKEVEDGVQQFAATEHISREEAVVRLVEAGLSISLPMPSLNPISQEERDRIVAEAMRKVEHVREDRAKELTHYRRAVGQSFPLEPENWREP